MKVRLLRLWETLSTSFWFVPLLMAAGGALLALSMGWVDGRLPRLDDGALEWLYVAGPSGARALLSTIAGSSITVASVVFSISIVALSTASAQFGPRLLPTFMQHGATQVALGTFNAAFIYALLVLSRVPETERAAELPSISIFVGLLTGIASFLVLIYFIHHVATFIRAPRIVDDVARSLERALGNVYPEGAGEGGECATDEEILARDPASPEPVRTISATASGYLQAVDAGGLIELAGELDTVIELRVRPGDALIEGQVMACFLGGEDPGDEAAERLVARLLTGSERTPIQDVEYTLDQLVEVALRALSPGVNDPFTAINCVERLGAALAVVADAGLPAAERRDEDGRVRLVVRPFTYTGIVDAAFDQLRQSARAHVAVSIAMLETIGRLAQRALPSSMARALRDQASLICEAANDSALLAPDRAALQKRYEATREALRGEGEGAA